MGFGKGFASGTFGFVLLHCIEATAFEWNQEYPGRPGKRKKLTKSYQLKTAQARSRTREQVEKELKTFQESTSFITDCGLNNRHVCVHSSGDWKSKIKRLLDSDPGEVSLGLEEAASSLCVCMASSQCMDGKSMLPGISYNSIAKPHLHVLFQPYLPPQRLCLQIPSYSRLELECMILGWGAHLLHSNK